MIKEQLKQLVASALTKLKITEPDIVVEYPLHSEFGDYATNIALKLSKTLKKNPITLAEEIVAAIPSSPLIAHMEVATPGFINFTIHTSTLIHYLDEVKLKNTQFGHTDTLQKKKVMIEYTDPNPFKEFHIGHLYSNIVGESLARLYEAIGAHVERACYQGDVGLHVAKSLWGMNHFMKEESVDVAHLEALPLEERVKFMGRAYAYGAKMYEENDDAKHAMHELNKKIYEHDASIYDLYKTGRTWSLEYFNTIYKKLGTTFNHHFFESEVGNEGIKYVKENLKKGIFKESKGAIIFEGEQYGLHTRVFINSLGLPTYEAKDLALAPTKYNTFAYDVSIIVTGNEINDYFKVVLKALELINPLLRAKTVHLSHGMVRLPEGKMSSRSGNIITGEWLIGEATEKARDIIKKTTKTQLSSNGKEHDHEQHVLAEKVALAAIRYALLKNTIGKNVEFDFNESISFDGNSGPYLQYTYVRCMSVLQKQISPETKMSTYAPNEEEIALLRYIPKFQEIILAAALNKAPNLISTFLFEFAALFNLFYQKHSILNTSDETKTFRLKLTAAVAQILKNGLYLLGIETVEKM
ncbi:MAG: arginyl-tRNA synthetase [Candidatus Parcubacteria bacterium]|jgi:arginyl-tRNA synthetase